MGGEEEVEGGEKRGGGMELINYYYCVSVYLFGILVHVGIRVSTYYLQQAMLTVDAASSVVVA